MSHAWKDVCDREVVESMIYAILTRQPSLNSFLPSLIGTQSPASSDKLEATSIVQWSTILVVVHVQCYRSNIRMPHSITPLEVTLSIKLLLNFLSNPSPTRMLDFLYGSEFIQSEERHQTLNMIISYTIQTAQHSVPCHSETIKVKQLQRRILLMFLRTPRACASKILCFS